jgi:hypothetical protein
VIPLLEAIVAQLSPDSTRWKESQVETMPGCVGVGVVMPFVEVAVAVVVVTVGVKPVTPVQI